jgi:homopolymeric O-antigen transport system permease protein
VIGIAGVIRDIYRYRTFVRNLVVTDLKLKYQDSTLGVAWSLLHPLLVLAVYTFAFRHVMRIPMENYPYFLMVGLLPWNFFASSVQASTRAIIGNAGLIRQAYFPREILPVSTVLFNLAQLLLAFSVFLPAMTLLSAVSLSWTAALVVPILGVHMLFTIGLALAMAALTTSFRDVTHFSEVGLFLLFWVTPILYPATLAPVGLRSFYRASPVAAFAAAYQDVLFFGRWPGRLAVSAMLGWTIAALLGGHAIFRWYSRTFAEEI